MKKIEGNMSVSNGSQLSMPTHIKTLFPRARVRRYKSHEKQGFMQEGPTEVKMIFQKINEHNVGNASADVSEKQIIALL